MKRLRDVMRDPRWADDEDSVSFLREAEALVAGKPQDVTAPKAAGPQRPPG